jgi:ABC-type bacteriocin/lantibiotic exporter with double-glycine peptidase domain
MDTSLLLAIGSIIGVVALAILQFSQAKVNSKTAKKVDIDIAAALIDKAMALNKEEYATIKDINEQLRKRIDEQEKIIEAHEEEIAKLKAELCDVEEDLRICKAKVGIDGGKIN